MSSPREVLIPWSQEQKEIQKEERIRQEDVTCAERSNSQRETKVRRMAERLESIQSNERSPPFEKEVVMMMAESLECPYCSKKFKDAAKYLEHIGKKHPAGD